MTTQSKKIKKLWSVLSNAENISRELYRQSISLSSGNKNIYKRINIAMGELKDLLTWAYED